MTTQQPLVVHPAAEIFPPMNAEEFQQLKHDIEENGLRQPLTMFNGQLLDGRHRWRACQNLGIEPRFEEYDGDPLTFVLSKNLHRRHLNISQRAMMAAQLAGAKHGGDRKAQICALNHAQAAKLFNVSERQVDNACALLDAAKAGKVGAEVIDAVFKGEMSINKALKKIDRPSGDQGQEQSAQDGRGAACGAGSRSPSRWLHSPERVTSNVERVCVELQQLAVKAQANAMIADRVDRLIDACRGAAQRLWDTAAVLEQWNARRPNPAPVVPDVDLD